MGEHYKAEIIESIPTNEVLSLYKQGDFVDLVVVLMFRLQVS